LLGNVLIFLLVAVGGGLGSSWYMIENGTRLTTTTSGPWVTWTAAGRSNADPYTRAHLMRQGTLPITTALAYTFQAKTDSDGQSLFANCEYLIEGEEPRAAFWSLALFDAKGGLIANPADRHAFNSATIMRGLTGRLDVVLSRSARPGNWLPTGGAGRLTLVLTMEEPRIPGATGTAADAARITLPAVRRITCH
jgi:hypothetical protein